MPTKLRTYIFSIIIVFILCLLTLPYLIEYKAKKWVSNLDGDNHLVDIKVNFWPISLQLYGLKLQQPEQQTLSIRELRINLSGINWFKQQISLDSVSISGVLVHIKVQGKQQYAISSLPFPLTQKKSAWTLQVDNLQLKDWQLISQYKKNHVDLRINTFNLHNWQQYSAKSLTQGEMVASLNNTPIHLKGEINILKPIESMELEITTGELEIADILSLFPQKFQLSGKLSAKMKLHKNAEQTANIQLQNIQFSYKDLSAQLQHSQAQLKLQLTSDHKKQYQFSANGLVSQQKMHIQKANQQLNLEQVALHQIQLKLQKNTDGQLLIDIKAPLTHLHDMVFSSSQIQAEQQDIYADLRLSAKLFQQDYVHLQLNGDLMTENFRLNASQTQEKLHIQQFSLNNLQLNLLTNQQHRISLQHQGNLSIQDFHWQTPLWAVQTAHIDWLGDVSLKPQNKTQLSEQKTSIFQSIAHKFDIIQQGQITLEKLSIQHNDTHISSDKLNADITTKTQHLPNELFNIASEGQIHLENTQIQRTEQQTLTIKKMDMPNYQINTYQDNKTQLHLKHTGNIFLGTIQLKHKHWVGLVPQLNWTGNSAIHNFNTPAQQSLINGVLTASSANLNTLDKRLSLTQNQLKWQGSIHIKGQKPNISGQLSSQRGKLSSPLKNTTLATWESLTAQGIRLNTDLQASLERLTIQQIKASIHIANTNQQQFFSIKKIQMFDLIRPSEQPININKVVIHELNADIFRNNQGLWQALDYGEQTQDILQVLNNITPQVKKETHASHVNIQELTIIGNSHLTIHDQHVKPEFKLPVAINKFTLKKLHTGKPHQNSPIEAIFSLGDYAKLNLTGDMQPFSAQKNIQFKTTLNAINLPTYAGYLEPIFGHHINSGQMDALMKFSIKNNNINGQVDLQLHQFNLGDKISNSKAVTGLQAGLSVLRDDENSIQLSLPIAGTLTKPDIDISDAIKQASSTAAKIGAVTYLASIIQPVGALVLIANAVDALTSIINFKPIPFKENSAVLTNKAKRTLKKAQQKIKKRPEIFIKICAFANHKEKLELALKRASVVKEHLIKQYAIPAKRLILCRPAHKKLSRDKFKFIPAVELSN